MAENDDDEEIDLDAFEDDPEPDDGAPRPPPPEPMRFYCEGADIKDRMGDGQPCCTFKDVKEWWGTCPGCGRWRACKPIKRAAESRMRLNLGDTSKVKPIKYWTTGVPELDLVLGGGLVMGKVVLLAGGRGAGKSTLVLQAANGFSSAKRLAYIVSGEDERDAIVHYAQRIGIENKNIEVFGDPRGLDVENVVHDAMDLKCRLLIVDSAQVCQMEHVKADVGQVAQLDAVINHLSSFAKQKKVAVIVIGHLTKEQEIAGSEKMQHLVDVLLRFDKKPIVDDDGNMIEGKDSPLRELWIDGKSRQGAEGTTALMEMTPKGLVPLSDQLRRRISRLRLV